MPGYDSSLGNAVLEAPAPPLLGGFARGVTCVSRRLLLDLDRLFRDRLLRSLPRALLGSKMLRLGRRRRFQLSLLGALAFLFLPKRLALCLALRPCSGYELTLTAFFDGRWTARVERSLELLQNGGFCF